MVVNVRGEYCVHMLCESTYQGCNCAVDPEEGDRRLEITVNTSNHHDHNELSDLNHITETFIILFKFWRQFKVKTEKLPLLLLSVK